MCDGQQLACTYCLDTVTLLQGSVNDAGVEVSLLLDWSPIMHVLALEPVISLDKRAVT